MAEIKSGCGDWPNCPRCQAVIRSIRAESGSYWAEPCCCALTAEQFTVLGKLMRPPWRFDVPAAIPAHVTALKDAGETVWLRLPDDTWTANRYMRSAGALFVHVVQYAHLPLVEYPDPRSTT